MKLLDLFCGAGGAAMGYHRAGFDEIVGVDINPQPNYPFKFCQADVTEISLLKGFDLIHASPPCQAYSHGTPDKTKHPRLIPHVRAMLEAAGSDWVIENVPGAPIRADYLLCGTMFGLETASGLVLQRHRLFEVSWVPQALGPSCAHQPGRTVSVTGNGTTSGNRNTLGRNVTVAEMREAMGIDWTNRRGLTEAIPPAYTEYLGRQFIAQQVAA